MVEILIQTKVGVETLGVGEKLKLEGGLFDLKIYSRQNIAVFKNPFYTTHQCPDEKIFS